MVDFTRKKIALQALGEKLQEMRQAKRKTVEEMADLSGVAEKYIKALESGRYQEIPGAVYTRIFIRKYAKALGLDPVTCEAEYDQERQFAPRTFSVIEHTAPLPERLRTHAHALLTIRNGLYALIAIVLLLLALFLGQQVLQFLAPPEVTISSPATDAQVDNLELMVTGTTVVDTRVFINGQETPLGDDGAFTQTLYLQPGRNEITITVRKKNGRETTVHRTILYTVPTTK